jgi:hypothetical protein
MSVISSARIVKATAPSPDASLKRATIKVLRSSVQSAFLECSPDKREHAFDVLVQPGLVEKGELVQHHEGRVRRLNVLFPAAVLEGEVVDASENKRRVAEGAVDEHETVSLDRLLAKRPTSDFYKLGFDQVGHALSRAGGDPRTIAEGRGATSASAGGLAA